MKTQTIEQRLEREADKRAERKMVWLRKQLPSQYELERCVTNYCNDNNEPQVVEAFLAAIREHYKESTLDALREELLGDIVGGEHVHE